jgi:hypothetical protein
MKRITVLISAALVGAALFLVVLNAVTAGPPSGAVDRNVPGSTTGPGRSSLASE